MTACSRRSVLGAAVAACAAPALLSAQERPAPAAKGRLTDESLGTLLKAMGLDAKLSEKRYDFTFKSTVVKEDWDLSMSAVLSVDGNTLWIMAWLDECPEVGRRSAPARALAAAGEKRPDGQGEILRIHLQQQAVRAAAGDCEREHVDGRVPGRAGRPGGLGGRDVSVLVGGELVVEQFVGGGALRDEGRRAGEGERPAIVNGAAGAASNGTTQAAADHKEVSLDVAEVARLQCF